MRTVNNCLKFPHHHRCHQIHHRRQYQYLSLPNLLRYMNGTEFPLRVLLANSFHPIPPTFQLFLPPWSTVASVPLYVEFVCTREPEKRPPAVVSNVFTVLCLLPFLIMLGLWIKVGANASDFPMSLSALGFHLGLAGNHGSNSYRTRR